ncbi:MAG: signal peptide peptidase SppA [Flavisolibacter sp.]
MRSFFKIFFASFLSLIVFTCISLFILFSIISNLTTKDRPDVRAKSILSIDLDQQFHERMIESPLASFSEEGNNPGVYDVVRLIERAKSDRSISGILITANNNANGFATSNEIRKALSDFKTSKKFIIANGDIMSQRAYFVASVADKIYLNPTGNFEWKGFAITFAFIKGMLEKLEIKPQIFYAGKYKSATEMFRTEKMTPENKLQTTVWLNSIYNYFLTTTSFARKVDTGRLHQLANNASIQKPQDALDNKLIDGLKYDDEVKSELKRLLSIGKYDNLNIISINKYYESLNLRKRGKDRIAVIYAEGNIVDGPGSVENIGDDTYRKMIRKVRLDNNIKAIVLRVNSGGGSALASDNIWRELQMARRDGKPVIVSFGDVAASGGYYIACGADSIFAHSNTITGSIGVFGIIPEMGAFFKNKLGVTFDGVKTGPYADEGAIYRPLNDAEQKQIQNSIDRTYLQFKQRVAEGRKKSLEFIDSIAQGRVWIGQDALNIGLIDKIGTLQDAIDCAARMAKTSNYTLREYPEPSGWLDNILNKKKSEPSALLKEKLGESNYRIYEELIKIKEMTNSAQAKMPFEFVIR